MGTELQPIVLFVEDDIVVADIYKSYLENEPIKLKHVDTAVAATNYLQQAIPAIILLDLGLSNLDGINILKYIKQHQLDCAVIVITAENSMDVIVKIMHYGIFDFLEKPLSREQLFTTLRKALYHQQLRKSIEMSPPPVRQYHKFMGASPPMQKIYQTIDKVAKSDATVLIMGESGTGKELCAEAIHQESHRRDKPFVVFNCATVPRELMESQLFGHVKGSFTGAEYRQGIAALANGGTLFLDEIGEMDWSLQRKLLRFVETNCIDKIGSDQLETVDIRFLWATNRNLPLEVKAGRFREDLYFRLKTISIRLPPLRQRGKDVLLLAQMFLDKYSSRAGKNFKGFSVRAKKLLLHYQWPGNVRQLQKCIEGVVLLNEDEEVTSDMLLATLAEEPQCYLDLPRNPPQATMPIQELWPSQEVPPSTLSVPITSGNNLLPFEAIKKDVILKSLDFCEGNITKTAKLLEIGHSTIYRWTSPDVCSK